jgi:hypothetical protein
LAITLVSERRQAIRRLLQSHDPARRTHFREYLSDKAVDLHERLFDIWTVSMSDRRPPLEQAAHAGVSTRVQTVAIETQKFSSD